MLEGYHGNCLGDSDNGIIVEWKSDKVPQGN